MTKSALAYRSLSPKYFLLHSNRINWNVSRSYVELYGIKKSIMSRSAIILLVGLGIFFADAFSLRLNCTRKHEIYECGSACQRTCSNLGQPCPIVNIRCNDGCYCKQNYARRGDDNSTCIPINECP